MAAALPAAAHHSTSAYFDMSKSITLTGVVTKVAIINPHAVMLIKVTNEKGQSETWALYGRGPHALMANAGYEKLKEGLTITVSGYPSRPGVQLGTLSSAITGPDVIKGAAEVGDVRLPNGELLPFGRTNGTTFPRPTASTAR
jgi:hypothetical protein